MNPLKPVRFYGRDLPRPRFLEGEDTVREFPPVPVFDALLRWAADANWAMGGLSYKKKRMQGKVEGRLSKLKNMEDDDEVSPKKAGRKPKTSPAKASPDSAMKTSSKSMKRKARAGVVKGLHGKGAVGSPVIVAKRLGAVHPVMGEWGEENGPSPRRMSPRLHASTPLKPASQSSPLVVSLSSPLAVSQSIEYPVQRRLVGPNASPSVELPVQRRQVRRALHRADDTDSDVNWEEFRSRDRPLRRSSRVTSVRRSFKDFEDSDHEN